MKTIQIKEEIRNWTNVRMPRSRDAFYLTGNLYNSNIHPDGTYCRFEHVTRAEYRTYALFGVTSGSARHYIKAYYITKKD